MRYAALILLLALAACGPRQEARKPAPPPISPPAIEKPAEPPAPVPVGKPKPKPGPIARELPKKYDDLIRRAVARWNCAPLWEMWWGQLMTESAMNPDAVSPAGARGLAQIMPGTWNDLKRKIDLGAADPHDVNAAIEAGCFEMARLRTQWKSPRPDTDRQGLAAASYNAGLGHILEAQRRCGGAALYAEIVTCLPDVTGPVHSRETLNYWPTIRRWTERKLAA